MLASLVAACASSHGVARPRETIAGARDLVTDLADDGSLLAGLSDPDPRRRLLAARALGRLPAPANTDALVGALSSEADAEVLAELCFALGRWAEASAREPLRRAASHPDERARAAAIDALARLGDDRLTTDVVQALDDPRVSVRSAAALALARLDGRRYETPRQATETMLSRRDDSLARVATDDPDAGVRWRAAFALASVRPRPAHAAALVACLADGDEPLTRAFALRGLIGLGQEGLVQAPPLADPFLDDADPRVAVEAARVIAELGGYDQLLELALTHRMAAVRVLAWEGLPGARTRARLRQRGNPSDVASRESLEAADARALTGPDSEPSPWVRRAALVALAHYVPSLQSELGPDWRELAAPLLEVERGRADLSARTLLRLATSPDRRDREAAAELLADGTLRDDDVLATLVSDPEPVVRAVALPALSDPRLASYWPRLREALDSDDVALIGGAATAAREIIATHRAPPWLTTAVANALGRAERDYTLEEARVDLAEALGLPPLDPVRPTQPTPEGSLLDRLEAEQLAVLEDPTPRVELQTDRGRVVLELDRARAPRHVENLLELAAAGFYDGLGFHRVVPGFVVQGLDPRGDGWGVGGRRVPDEFSSRPYLTGTLGMPRVGRPHTGGCQIFITHLPTPHLDGDYTVFGQVVEGMDVVAAWEVGDEVRSVRRLDG